MTGNKKFELNYSTQDGVEKMVVSTNDKLDVIASETIWERLDRLEANQYEMMSRIRALEASYDKLIQSRGFNHFVKCEQKFKR